jgi:hypothetical protein
MISLDASKLGSTTMKYPVGVTDNSWLEFSANLKPDNEGIVPLSL